IHLVSALLRRSAIDWDAVPEDAASAYDRYLGLEAAADANAGHYTAQRLAAYRVHSASDSVTNLLRQQRGSVWALEAALRSGRHTDVEVLKENIAGGSLRLARLYLRDGQREQAHRLARRSVELRATREAVRL